MKIAIIGAGISGLSCAMECEKLGVIPDVFERDYSVGWPWLSMNYWPNVFLRYMGEPFEYIKKHYDIEMTPINECKTVILKSPGQEVKIEGKLGYFVSRGKGSLSKESMLLGNLKKGTAVHFNSRMDFRDLASKYDYVVVATGSEKEAKELGVWENQGIINIFKGIALGSFHDETSIMYLNTEYAGTGYARITPFNPSQAIVCLYNDRDDELDMHRLYDKFLKYEKLDGLEFLYKFSVPPFATGRVKKFRVDNILLTGRSAGLTERLLGVGAPEAIMSGVLAARAIIENKDYEKLIAPLRQHVENISAFRKLIQKFENKDFDKLLSILAAPGIKQAVYNSSIDLTDFAGHIIKLFNKDHASPSVR